MTRLDTGRNVNLVDNLELGEVADSVARAPTGAAGLATGIKPKSRDVNWSRIDHKQQSTLKTHTQSGVCPKARVG